MQYDDAFTLQRVSDEQIENFFYVAGMVPFLQKLIADVSRFDRIGACRAIPDISPSMSYSFVMLSRQVVDEPSRRQQLIY